jgi:hypothetical protein
MCPEHEEGRIDLSQLGFEIAISRADENDDSPLSQQQMMDVSTSSYLEEDLAAPLPSRKDLGYDDEEPGAVSSVHSALSMLSVGKPVRNKRSSIRRSICSSTRRSTCSNSTESSSIYTALSVGRPIRTKRSSVVSLRRSICQSNHSHSCCHKEEDEEPEPEEDEYARHKALIALKFSRQQQQQQPHQTQEEDEDEDGDYSPASRQRRSSVVSALSSSGSGYGDEDFSTGSYSRRAHSRNLCRQSYRRQNARMPSRGGGSDNLHAAIAAARAAVVCEED